MPESDRPETAAWRPQSFGSRSFRDVADPLVEPLWTGIRVLAHVSDEDVALFDDQGGRRSLPSIEAGLAIALRAAAAIIDGYLTSEAARTGEGIGAALGAEAPTAGQVARQMIVGGGATDRRRHLVESLEASASRAIGEEDDIAFVAVDLVALDGEPLLDVPLLERKRLLDSILEEGEIVRRGVHVRPPVDTWVATWRAMGFRGLAYKGANSRYRPGERNNAWATAPMPRN
jgi:ATP-dependent DNA ligase